MRHRSYKDYSTVELTYINAANTLDYDARLEALRDIADLCGRDLYAVRIKADRLLRNYDWRLHQTSKVTLANESSGLVPVRRVPGFNQRTAASGFRWKPKTQKLVVETVPASTGMELP